ncbi:MAG: SIMPL domain-containing protein [Sphingomicrobium sp.]
MHHFSLLAALAVAGPSLAQSADKSPTIHVTGSGTVSSMPDSASLELEIIGEGKTPDDATRALAARQKAIAGALGNLLSGDAVLTTGDLAINAVPGANCRRNEDDDDPKLSEGPCAIAGYVAKIGATINTSQVLKAGTAVGLASRLGARNAHLDAFAIKSRKTVYREAMTRAYSDARSQAELLAAAAGGRLGAVITINEPNPNVSDAIMVTGLRRLAGVSANRSPEPVPIDIAPEPIDTTTSIEVTFALDK